MLRGIRWKLALGIALPVLISLIGFSMADYYRRTALLRSMAETTACFCFYESESYNKAQLTGERQILLRRIV